jgi:hypothetical protein
MKNARIVAICPACSHEFEPPRRTRMKMAVTAGGAGGGAVAGASIGASIGSGIGVASGGTAAAATVPLGVIGGTVGGLVFGIGARYSAEWAAARHLCPACGHRFTTQGRPRTQSDPPSAVGASEPETDPAPIDGADPAE